MAPSDSAWHPAAYLFKSFFLLIVLLYNQLVLTLGLFLPSRHPIFSCIRACFMDSLPEMLAEPFRKQTSFGLQGALQGAPLSQWLQILLAADECKGRRRMTSNCYPEGQIQCSESELFKLIIVTKMSLTTSLSYVG